MRYTRMSFIPAALAAAMLSLPILAIDVAPAHADVSVRVSGKVRVRAKARVRVRPRRVLRRHHRVTHRPRVRLHVDSGIYWGGGIYVGPRYYAAPPPPPPPPPYCDCEHDEDRGRYAEPPPPRPRAYAPPAPVVATQRPVRRALPRLGIGVFAGSIDVDGETQGDELGLFGRLRLTDHFYVEGEIAHTEMTTSRIDRRVGGALLYDFSPRSRFSLNILGGAGVTQSETDSDFVTEQGYGELGLGLTYRPTRRFHLAADVRAGARQQAEIAPASDSLKAIAPSAEEDEPFTRGRLSAILYF